MVDGIINTGDRFVGLLIEVTTEDMELWIEAYQIIIPVHEAMLNSKLGKITLRLMATRYDRKVVEMTSLTCYKRPLQDGYMVALDSKEIFDEHAERGTAFSISLATKIQPKHKDEDIRYSLLLLR